jgi:hypothetical protein
MGWWCGIGEEDDNEKKWEVLRNIWLATMQKGIRSSQVICYTQVDCCCIWQEVAGNYHRPATHNMSVRSCKLVNRDQLRCLMAEID